MAIPNSTKQVHHVGSVIEDIAMSIRAEDFPHLADLLNGLYSDPIAAVIREYSTNGLDSHITAGNPDPIQVTLPTAERLEFTVQDFGLGLSIDDLRNVYSMYGRSLKRDSNDVAGQLGLGCKSALSYAEAFTITAVKGGVKVIAMSTKDENGVGVIKILDTVGTTEPNGVKITVPVDRWDVSDFQSAATNLFQFWEPGTVLIDGIAPEVPEWRSTALQLDDDTFLVRKDVGLYRSHVIMGNVAYPVPDAEFGRESYRFVARLNIGDVDFTPSREEVKYTTRTKETLAALSAYVTDTFKRAIAAQLAAATTPWEEAMLKVLWMDRNLRLTSPADRPIWSYTPSGYGKKANSTFHYNLSKLTQPSTVIITNFPAKNVSVVARERIGEFPLDIAKPNFVILPTGISGIGNLEGRPNVFTWDQILGATAEPAKVKTKVKREKYETLYSTVGGPSMTAAELAEVDGTILYLMPNESPRYGHLGATVVSLYSTAQLPRVQRFVPHISPYEDEVDRQRKAALAAITDDDRRLLQAKGLSHIFTNFDPNKISDPELATYVRLAKADDTPTILAARRFGLSIDTKPLPDFLSRYPLVAGNHYGVDSKKIDLERLFYINARYEAAQAAQAAAAERVAS